jgi:hypothetical protein
VRRRGPQRGLLGVLTPRGLPGLMGPPGVQRGEELVGEEPAEQNDGESSTLRLGWAAGELDAATQEMGPTTAAAVGRRVAPRRRARSDGRLFVFP